MEPVQVREDVEFVAGLGAIESDEEFLGKVKRNAKKVKTAMRNTAKAAKNAGKTNKTTVNVPATAASASGKEMAAMVSLLSPELQQGLKDGSKQMVDATIYVTKLIGGKTNIRMFEDSDDKMIGVANISKAKLEKNEVFCLSAIQVLYGTAAADDMTQANIAPIEWKEIPANVQNGEFTFRAGVRTVFDKMANQIFKNHNIDNIQASSANVGGVAYGHGELGFYKLANPMLLRTQEALDMFVEWAAAAESHAFMKVVLYGTKIMSK